MYDRGLGIDRITKCHGNLVAAYDLSLDPNSVLGAGSRVKLAEAW